MLKRVVVIGMVLALTACATSVPQMPKEIKLKDPTHRVSDDVAGRTPQETATKCAYNMVNAGPSSVDSVTDIKYQIIGVDNPLVIEVSGVFMNMPFYSGAPSTFRCEYMNGRMLRSFWVAKAAG